MAFDWTHDLSHIVTNFYFQSYSVGGTTTVDDLMQVYLMKTADRTVTGHCFRTDFTTLTDKSSPSNSWALGLASPGVIYMVHRAKETSTLNTGQLEVNLYRVSEVVTEGGAYSAGASDMTDVIAHDPYLSVAIPQVAGYTTTAKQFEVVPWRSDTLLIVDTVNGVREQWRVHEVSLIDGTVTTHSTMFGSGSDSIANYCCSFTMRDGRLFVNAAANSWIINTTTWVSDDTAALSNATLMELSDGTFFFNDRASGVKYLYDSSLVQIGLLSSDPEPNINLSLSRDYSNIVLWGQQLSTIGVGEVGEVRKTSFVSTTATVTTFPAYTTNNENYGWGCVTDGTYWMYYDPGIREFSLVTLANGTAHPSISNWKEVDSDIPTGGNASDTGNWGAIVSGAAAPTGSTVWPRINVCGDHITLQYGYQNGDFIATYPVNAVGIANNDGSPIPLLRASDLVVSDASASSSYMKLRDVHVPTVDNILAGANINITTSGANVTIASSGGGGGSGGVAGAYDIEVHGEPIYTDAGLSEEFEDGTLNGLWTITNGTAGTADLLTTVAGPIYDLSTRSKGMLVQTHATSGMFQMRCSVSEIANNEEVIVSIGTSESAAPTTNDTYRAGISVTSGSSNYADGNRGLLIYDGGNGTNGGDIVSNGTGSAVTAVVTNVGGGQRMYFRCVRTSSGFWFFFSRDGIAWIPTGMYNPASVAYFWVYVGCNGTYTRPNNAPDPISCINWIRHVAYSGVDPW